MRGQLASEASKEKMRSSFESIGRRVKFIDIRLEVLRGRWKGFHSIRINDQWRIVFRWKSGNAFDVQIVDYH